MKKYINIFIMASLFVPVAVNAQFTGAKGLIEAFGGLINPLIAVLVGMALIVFFWGLARFIFRVGGDEKAVDDGKRIMKWGLLALFVMLSVWGIISFFQRELNLPTDGSSTLPNSNINSNYVFPSDDSTIWSLE
ncbi:MAG: hypothetical protein Q7S48_01215 [bacterium]|nr:hypothetical protein [bacterium]